MQLLLEKGPEINVQGGFFGNALQAASSEGHDSIVQFLLKNGAEINTEGGFFGNALQSASYRGHSMIVQLLLKNRAKSTSKVDVTVIPSGLRLLEDMKWLWKMPRTSCS